MSKEHLLRAMAQNYATDHVCDDLDRNIMLGAAEEIRRLNQEIKHLRLERSALRTSLEKMMNDEGLVVCMRPDQVDSNKILLELVNND